MTLPLSPAAQAPARAKSRASLPEGDDWAYEPKYDGFRAIVFVDDGDVYSSRGRPSRWRATSPS